MLTYQHQQMRMQQQAAWQQQQQMQLQAAAAASPGGRFSGASQAGLPITTLGPATTALPRRVSSTGNLGSGFGPASFGPAGFSTGSGGWPAAPSANLAAIGGGGGSGLIYPPASGPAIIAGIYGGCSNGSLSSIGSLGSDEGQGSLAGGGLPSGASSGLTQYGTVGYGGQLGSGLQPLTQSGASGNLAGTATEPMGANSSDSDAAALISRQGEPQGGISTAMVQTAVPPTGPLLPFLRAPITIQGGAVQAGGSMHAEARAHTVGLDGKPLDAAVAVDDAAASTPGGGHGQRHRVATITQRDMGGQPLLVALGIDSNTQQASGASTGGGGPAGAQLTHIEAHSLTSAPSGVPVSVDVALDVKATMGNAAALPGSAAHQQAALLMRQLAGSSQPAGPGQWQSQPAQLTRFGEPLPVVSQQLQPTISLQQPYVGAGVASGLPSQSAQQPVARSPFEGLAGSGPGLGPISRGQGLFGSSPELFSSETPGSVAGEVIAGSSGSSGGRLAGESQAAGGGAAGAGLGFPSGGQAQAQALSPAGSLGLSLFETPPAATNAASKPRAAGELSAQPQLPVSQPEAADVGLGSLPLRGPGEWDQSAGGVAAYTGEADAAHVEQRDAPRSIVMAGGDLADAMLQDEQAEAAAAAQQAQAKAVQQTGSSIGVQSQVESGKLDVSSSGSAGKPPQAASSWSGQPAQPQQALGSDAPFAGW